MPTIVRYGPLRVIIYLEDHDPPHVHVIGDGETKIALGNGPDAITVIYSMRTKANERRQAVEAVRHHHAMLLQRWSELNG